jgi:hypothetical protein
MQTNPLQHEGTVATQPLAHGNDHGIGSPGEAQPADELTSALQQPYSAFHRFWFWMKQRIERRRTANR